jgi:hypothetical protein
MGIVKDCLNLFEIDAHLTTACNYKCSYCINEAQRLRIGMQMMKLETFANILKIFDTVEAKTKVITLFGGEPTLNKRYVEICNMALDHGGLRVDTLTNLSRPIEFFHGIEGDPKNIKFSFSYHIEMTPYDEYVSKLSYFIDKGYQGLNICLVGPFDRWNETYDVYKKLVLAFPEISCNFTPDSKSERTKEYANWVESIGGVKTVSEIRHEVTSTMSNETIDIRPSNRFGQACIIKPSVAPNGDIYDCNGDFGGPNTIGNVNKSFKLSRVRVCTNKFLCPNISVSMDKWKQHRIDNVN